MNIKMIDITIEYLESIVAFEPAFNPSNMGECFYCRAKLSEGNDHFPYCHYLEAKRLLEEFKNKKQCNLDSL